MVPSSNCLGSANLLNIEILAKTFGKVAGVKVLDLGYNNLGNGIRNNIKILAEGIKNMSGLEVLDLCGNDFSSENPENLKWMVNAIINNESISTVYFYDIDTPIDVFIDSMKPLKRKIKVKLLIREGNSYKNVNQFENLVKISEFIQFIE